MGERGLSGPKIQNLGKLFGAHLTCDDGFARNCHFQGTANLGYLEAIKCHFKGKNGKF